MGEKYLGREAKKMSRVHIICEGHTEEMFVNELLVPHMATQGIIISPAKMGRPGHKGGKVNYQRLLIELKNRLLKDRDCYCTTLFDYYGLPNRFPGKSNSDKLKVSQDKFNLITKALHDQVTSDIGEAANRFIPYIQLHEFEALLFSKPELLAQSLQQCSLETDFHKIRNNYASPEDINDSPHTAPSKRIQLLYPSYDKPIHPVLAAIDIGLNVIRQNCLLFDSWLKSIESIVD